MNKGLVKYRKVPPWKYQLTDNVPVIVPTLTPLLDADFDNGFIMLARAGTMLISKGYSWDGPSGPTIDSKSAMRASLVHDALYQLIRLGILRPGFDARSFADFLFHAMLREDGMGRFRAWYYYMAVRTFGGSAAKVRKPEPVRSAP